MPGSGLHFIESLTILGERVGWTPLQGLHDAPAEAACAPLNWLPIQLDKLEGIAHEGVERSRRGSLRSQTRDHL
ncbi:MAG: hypothetical protein H8E47_02535 [Anaerolineales bacterium]|nr:hypothetical protein [Anaerolineales bacterium]